MAGNVQRFITSDKKQETLEANVQIGISAEVKLYHEIEFAVIMMKHMCQGHLLEMIVSKSVS